MGFNVDPKCDNYSTFTYEGTTSFDKILIISVNRNGLKCNSVFFLQVQHATSFALYLWYTKIEKESTLNMSRALHWAVVQFVKRLVINIGSEKEKKRARASVSFLLKMLFILHSVVIKGFCIMPHMVVVARKWYSGIDDVTLKCNYKNVYHHFEFTFFLIFQKRHCHLLLRHK